MKKMILCTLAALALQGCVVQVPTATVTSNVLEADKEKGNQIALEARHCEFGCLQMAMNKAQEVCPAGYVIQNKSQSDVGALHMVVRCRPKTAF